VSARHDDTIARTTGSFRVGLVILAQFGSASLIVPSYDARMPAPSRTHRTADDTGQPISGETPADGVATEGEPAGFFDAAALGGSNALAGLLMAGGVLIITFILMSRLRRKQRERPSDLSTAEQIAQIRARAADSRGIDAFKADAHDFTRQMAALLDSKAERLEQLIADADDRLARLDQLEHDASHTAPADPPRAHAEPTPPPQPKRTPPDLERPVEVDPLHDKVYRLADSGLDPVSIAREIGQPTGQIELILALRG
jgi:hypothetical protein